MGQLFIDILTFLYATVGMVSLLAYWPTIRDLLQKKPSANATSYVIWGFTTGIAFMYSLFVLHDFWLRVISGLNFVICFKIAVLSVHLKRQQEKNAGQSAKNPVKKRRKVSFASLRQ